MNFIPQKGHEGKKEERAGELLADISDMLRRSDKTKGHTADVGRSQSLRDSS